MSWADLFKKIRPYIMYIETPRVSGTAFLFTYNKGKTVAGFATAAHVVSHADDWKEPIKLIHYETKREFFLTDDDRVIFIDLARDSAVILTKNDDLGTPQETLPLIDPDKFLSIGVEVGWVGFPSIASPNLCIFTGRISSHIKDFDSYLIDGVAINGVSGGPVFYSPQKTSMLKIIGTVSLYMPNRIYGDTLPGLLRVQDVTTFHNTINAITSWDEAREKQAEQVKEERKKSSSTPPKE